MSLEIGPKLRLVEDNFFYEGVFRANADLVPQRNFFPVDSSGLADDNAVDIGANGVRWKDIFTMSIKASTKLGLGGAGASYSEYGSIRATTGTNAGIKFTGSSLEFANFVETVSQIGLHIDDTGIASSSLDTTAILELVSSTRGFMPPRNADPVTNIVSPGNGLIAYDSTDDELQYYNGTSWVSLTGGGGSAVTALNGLTYTLGTPDEITLGGTLNQTTNIEIDGKDLNISSTTGSGLLGDVLSFYNDGKGGSVVGIGCANSNLNTNMNAPNRIYAQAGLQFNLGAGQNEYIVSELNIEKNWITYTTYDAFTLPGSRLPLPPFWQWNVDQNPASSGGGPTGLQMASNTGVISYNTTKFGSITFPCWQNLKPNSSTKGGEYNIRNAINEGNLESSEVETGGPIGGPNGAGQIRSRYFLWNKTTDAAPVSLYADGNNATSEQRIHAWPASGRDNQISIVKGTIMAIHNSTGGTKIWEVNVFVKSIGYSTPTITIMTNLGTFQQLEKVAEDAALASAGLAVSIDSPFTGKNYIDFEVTGIAATDIAWSADLIVTRQGYSSGDF